MIELIDFSKSYSSKSGFVVKNINMTCNKGEITGLLGLNGSGKTTILKAVTGRHCATSGKVFVEGVESGENLETVRNLSGFVEEEPYLPGEYTVKEFLVMSAMLHGLQKKSEWQDLTSLSLDEILSKKIRTLSKGQRQRLNFARSLIYNPPVLVLDEPATGLDPAQILNMRSFVKSLKTEHTILLSTHLMQEVEALCDKVYILNQGTIVAFGTPREISENNDSKTLEEAFFKLVKNNQEKN